MGAAASFDNGLAVASDGEHYFCHSCHRVFGFDSIDPQEFHCPQCQSTFLEEIGSTESGLSGSLRHRSHGHLTADQARRITNATAMLRLLESQLRDELEQLQHAFEAANARFVVDGSYNKPKKLTKVMQSRLRHTFLNLDLICSQPSCPVCSEDFILGTDAFRLPCSHLFHEPCVMPWLEIKQNCPICRADLPDSLPTTADLEHCSIVDLKQKLRDLDVEEEVMFELDQGELSNLLVEKLAASQRDLTANESTASANAEGLPMLLPTTMLRSMGFPLMTMALNRSNSGSGTGRLRSLQTDTTQLQSDSQDNGDDDDSESQYRSVGVDERGIHRTPALLLRRSQVRASDNDEEGIDRSGNERNPPRGYVLRSQRPMGSFGAESAPVHFLHGHSGNVGLTFQVVPRSVSVNGLNVSRYETTPVLQSTSRSSQADESSTRATGSSLSQRLAAEVTHNSAGDEQQSSADGTS